MGASSQTAQLRKLKRTHSCFHCGTSGFKILTTTRTCWSNSGDSDQAAHVHALIIASVAHVRALDYLVSSYCLHVIKILNDFSV